MNSRPDHDQPVATEGESTSPDGVPSLDLSPGQLPRHIAVIMDGNGRWAVARNRSRIEGHRAGARSVRDTVTECGRLGIEVLTLYSFSIENWKRPAHEVGALMELCHEYLKNERQEMLDKNVRFVQVGRRDGLPREVLDGIDECAQATAHCTGLTLALALNYGSRAEITDAVRGIARDVRAGAVEPDDITETMISHRLYTAGLPDPDLMIRTAGEFRLSNYLLWQASYAELYVTDTLWPDFGVADLHTALREFAARRRRFGGLDHDQIDE